LIIDLKNISTTRVYLDTLIMNNFTPVVVMPTRITDRSATLIDHINFCYSDCGKHNASSIITGGNLWCDITDHLPNFVFLHSSRGKNMIVLHCLLSDFIHQKTLKNL